MKKSDASLVKEFEFKYLVDEDFACDILTNNGTLIDLKSWSVSSSIDKIGGWKFSDQLKTYFNNPPFEMWFDFSRFKSEAKYASYDINQATKHVREQYQKLFMKNNYDLYESIKSSHYLEDMGIRNHQQFINAVDNIDSHLYQFILLK